MYQEAPNDVNLLLLTLAVSRARSVGSCSGDKLTWKNIFLPTTNLRTSLRKNHRHSDKSTLTILPTNRYNFLLLSKFFLIIKKGLLVHYFSFHFFFKQEQIRDSNFNTFWNKIPQMDSNWEETRNRCPSNCSSEDSRSLDVTGSEDEGEGIREGRDGWRHVLRPVPRFPYAISNSMYPYSSYGHDTLYFS